MIRLFAYTWLVAAASVFITLIIVDPNTARDVGVVYAIGVGTLSISLHVDWKQRD